MRGKEERSDTSTEFPTEESFDRWPSGRRDYWGEPEEAASSSGEAPPSAAASLLGTPFDFNGWEYQIHSQLGAGGFATTFLAKPGVDGHEQLVVKVPNDHVLSDPTWQRKFHRESSIAANRVHRNLVSIKGLIQLPGAKPAILQEYVEDAKELGKLPAQGPASIGSILAQALYGLRALHKEINGSRIIHRDISPQNILVSGSGLVKIIDFGLAKDEPRKLPQLTRSFEAFGTAGCMAPEQEKGAAAVDERADLFSLGKSIAAHLQQRTPHHVQIHELPAPWQKLLDKMTAFKKTQRYASAEVAIHALLAAFNELGRTFESPGIHCDEFNQWDAVPQEWIQMANAYIAELDHPSRIDFCHRLGPKVYTSEHFEMLEAYGHLDESIGDLFDDGYASFGSCDPVGTILERWYANLKSPPARQNCFRRLVKIAVKYNRYSLMGQARRIFASADREERQRLQPVISEEDPTGIIRFT